MFMLEVIVGSVPVRLMVPATEKLIVSSPARAFASCNAARKVQRPPASAHIPLPGAASEVSARELTVKVAAARETRSGRRNITVNSREMITTGRVTYVYTRWAGGLIFIPDSLWADELWAEISNYETG